MNQEIRLPSTAKICDVISNGDWNWPNAWSDTKCSGCYLWCCLSHFLLMILYFGNLLLKGFSFEEAYWSRLVKEGSGLVSHLEKAICYSKTGRLVNPKCVFCKGAIEGRDHFLSRNEEHMPFHFSDFLASKGQ